MALDPFTNDLLLFGGETINQIDPTHPTVVRSSKTITGLGLLFDQGTVDGFGHLFIA